MLPPLIVQLLLMRGSNHGPEYEVVNGRFLTCMAALKKLGEIYWHASFYYEFFELTASGSQTTSAANQHATAPEITFGGRTPGKHTNKDLGLQSCNSTRTGSGEAVGTTGQEMVLGTDRAPFHQQHAYHGETSTATPDLETPSPSSFHALSGDTLGLDGHTPGDVDFIGTEAGAFESWLDDYGLFQSMFPSA